MKNRYLIQPCDLGTMVVECDAISIEQDGVVFYDEVNDLQEVVFYAPNHNTKYVSLEGYSDRVKV